MLTSPPMSQAERIATYAKAALMGQTPRSLRQYSFDFDADAKWILFKAEVSRELTEDETENLAVAETEMYAASIFGDDTCIETRIEVVLPEASLNPLKGGALF